jgi:hypothetical protein
MTFNIEFYAPKKIRITGTSDFYSISREICYWNAIFLAFRLRRQMRIIKRANAKAIEVL